MSQNVCKTEKHESNVHPHYAYDYKCEYYLRTWWLNDQVDLEKCCEFLVEKWPKN